MEDHNFQACLSIPNVDTPATQEDKPGDCKLEVNKSVILYAFFWVIPRCRGITQKKTQHSGLGKTF